MGGENYLDGDLNFDLRNLNLLQAALGFHSPYLSNSNFADRPFYRPNENDNALLMYMKNWNLFDSKTGLSTDSYRG